MREPKARPARQGAEERELPPEALAEAEKLARRYSKVLKELADH